MRIHLLRAGLDGVAPNFLNYRMRTIAYTRFIEPPQTIASLPTSTYSPREAGQGPSNPTVGKKPSQPACKTVFVVLPAASSWSLSGLQHESQPWAY